MASLNTGRCFFYRNITEGQQKGPAAGFKASLRLFLIGWVDLSPYKPPLDFTSASVIKKKSQAGMCCQSNEKSAVQLYCTVLNYFAFNFVQKEFREHALMFGILTTLMQNKSWMKWQSSYAELIICSSFHLGIDYDPVLLDQGLASWSEFLITKYQRSNAKQRSCCTLTNWLKSFLNQTPFIWCISRIGRRKLGFFSMVADSEVQRKPDCSLNSNSMLTVKQNWSSMAPRSWRRSGESLTWYQLLAAEDLWGCKDWSQRSCYLLIFSSLFHSLSVIK